MWKRKQKCIKVKKTLLNLKTLQVKCVPQSKTNIFVLTLSLVLMFLFIETLFFMTKAVSNRDIFLLILVLTLVLVNSEIWLYFTMQKNLKHLLF